MKQNISITRKVNKTETIQFDSSVRYYRTTASKEGHAAIIDGLCIQVHTWGIQMSNTSQYESGIRSFFEQYTEECTEQDFVAKYTSISAIFTRALSAISELSGASYGTAIPDWEVQLLSAVSELLTKKNLVMWSDIAHLQQKVLLPDSPPQNHLYKYVEESDQYAPAGFLFYEVNSTEKGHTVSIYYNDAENLTHGVRTIGRIDAQTREMITYQLIEMGAILCSNK